MPIKDEKSRREYHAKYMRDRWQTDPEFRRKHLLRVTRNAKKYRREARLAVSEWKSRGCAICGEREQCCLSAHHVDPKKKSFTLGGVGRSRRSLPSIVKELTKCICLCENCHRKVHAGIVKCPTIPTA